jgi:hypothetical protein
MKRTLSILAVVAVLFLGVVGALAVIPHAHGKDFDHSEHATCPIYQLSLQNFSAVFPDVLAAAAFFLFCYFVSFKKDGYFSSHSSVISSRAPPVCL